MRVLSCAGVGAHVGALRQPGCCHNKPTQQSHLINAFCEVFEPVPVWGTGLAGAQQLRLLLLLLPLVAVTV